MGVECLQTDLNKYITVRETELYYLKQNIERTTFTSFLKSICNFIHIITVSTVSDIYSFLIINNKQYKLEIACCQKQITVLKHK